MFITAMATLQSSPNSDSEFEPGGGDSDDSDGSYDSDVSYDSDDMIDEAVDPVIDQGYVIIRIKV